MKPQNKRVKRKFDLLRIIFPNQCLCDSAFKKQFAHKCKNGFGGKGRGRNKRFWNIINNYLDYFLLCEMCHYDYDHFKTIRIMTIDRIKEVNKNENCL